MVMAVYLAELAGSTLPRPCGYVTLHAVPYAMLSYQMLGGADSRVGEVVKRGEDVALELRGDYQGRLPAGHVTQ